MAANANFPVWRDLIFSDQSLGTQSITNAGRTYSNTAGGAEIFGYVDTRIPRTGKWYWEIHVKTRGSSTASIGVVSEQNHYEKYSSSRSLFNYTGPGSYDNEKPIYGNNGKIWYGDSSTQTSDFATWTTGDTIGVAIDSGNNKIFWSKNGTWQNNANPSTGTTGGIDINYDVSEFLCLPAIVHYQSGVYTCNFGQDSSFCGEVTAQGNADGNGYGDFYYTPPTNYLAICSANQPVPAAADPSHEDSSEVTLTSNHKTGIYTGTGTARNITGLGFQPDMVWISQRSTGTTSNNYMFDSSRGVGKYDLINSTAVEATDANSLTAFGTDGFSLGTSGAGNANTQTYVYAAWKINGGTTATNTSGTLTSTVQANQDLGMSIVQYTSTGTDVTVGHGLAEPLDWYVVKKRTDQARDSLMYVRTSGPGKYGKFGGNGAFGSDTGLWNNTDPTSTVFHIDGNTTEVNNPSGIAYYAYCFHSVVGYSSFGNFYGNADDDGAFVPLDFTPSMVIIKQIGGTDDWGMYTSPTQTNANANPLELVQRYDSTNGEQGSTGGRQIDFLAGGFKLRTSNATFNEGDYYFYAAWSAQPSKFPVAFGTGS